MRAQFFYTQPITFYENSFHESPVVLCLWTAGDSDLHRSFPTVRKGLKRKLETLFTK
jgi:hypothetical protein